MSDEKKSAQTAPKSNLASSMQNGSAVLTKTGFSLLAAILALVGAIGLAGVYLFDPIFQGSIKYFVSTFDHVLRFFEAALLITASILIFKARTTGKSLKIPMLLWGASALFGLPFAVYSSLQLFGQSNPFSAVFFLLIKVLPLLAAFFAILYVFTGIQKRLSLIILGLLLGAVLAVGTAVYVTNLFSSLAYPVFDVTYIRTGLLIVYYLFFPTGMFLTVLASKEK